MSTTPKPTRQFLAALREAIEVADVNDRRVSLSVDEARTLLDGYEATQRPIVAEPDHPAPLSVAELPAFWRARRERAGKNASLCADELERALEHARAATPEAMFPDVLLRGSWPEVEP